MNILPPSTSAGGRLGSKLGSGLENLAQNKLDTVMQQYQQQAQKSQYAKGIEPIVGPQVAKFLSNLGEKERGIALQNLDLLMEKFPSGNAGAANGLGALAGNGVNNMEGASGSGAAASEMQPAIGNKSSGGIAALTDKKPPAGNIFRPKADQRADENIDLKRETNTESSRKNKATEEFRERKLTDTKISDALKDSSKWRNAVQDKAITASEDLRVLKEMRELNDSGDLTSGPMIKLLSFFGLDDVGELKNPKSEQYQKLQTYFLRNLKSIFGAKPTEFEVREYMKSVPTLMNTPEGRERIYNDMQNVAEAAQLENKILDELMEKYQDSPKDLKNLKSKFIKESTPIVDEIRNRTPFGSKKKDLSSTEFTVEVRMRPDGTPEKWDASQKRYRTARKV